MSLIFPYQPKPFQGPPGAVHPSGATQLWRPIIQVRLVGPASSMPFPQALVDPGSADTIFPWGAGSVVGAGLKPDTGYVVRWRGTAYPLRFADVELELQQGGNALRWPALVGFTKAPLPHVLLGYFGFLAFMDATLRGDDRLVELEPNAAYPGTT